MMGVIMATNELSDITDVLERARARRKGEARKLPAGWTQAKFDKAREDLARLSDPSAGNLCYGDGHYAKSLVERYGMSTGELERIVGTPVFTPTLEWK